MRDSKAYLRASTVLVRHVTPTRLASQVWRVETALRRPVGALFLGATAGVALALAALAIAAVRDGSERSARERSLDEARGVLVATSPADASGAAPGALDGEGTAEAARTLRGDLQGAVAGPRAPEELVARLIALDGAPETPEVARAEVAADGSFALRGVPPGCYALRFARTAPLRPAGDAGRVCIAEGGSEFIAVVLVE